MPELNSVILTNDLTLRFYFRDSAGGRSQINGAVLSIDYQVP